MRRPSTALRARASVALLFFALAVVACDTGVLVVDRDASDGAADHAMIDVATDAADRPPIDVPQITDTMMLCTTDMDCQGDPRGPHCDLDTQTCRACLSHPNTCPAGQYCDATFACVAGCSADVDCASADGGTDGGAALRRCDVPNHACVECLGDLDCGGDLVCRGNRCTMGCSATRLCPAGLSCCDGGCIDLLDTHDHCGTCAHACDTADTCCGGICYALQTDERHCGSCTNRCSVMNGVAGCAAGACTVSTCTPGYGDCDGNAANGCEVNLGNDPTHCGACSTACTSGAHVASICDTGVCRSTCAPGYLHCSSDPAAGCEVDPQTDPNNCGVCGNVCSGDHVASGGCTTGACTIVSCNPGFTDCDGAAGNGCESDTASDVLNCGACFRVCPTGAYSRPTCGSGTCGVMCLAGHGDCDADPTTGCEADFASNPAHCGSCAGVCPSAANATSVCNSGACGFYCNGTFQDCDRAAANGCEANLVSDVANCGACGNACSAAHGSVACTSGACALTSCNTGFANCNGTIADGCETATTTDPLNCGGCNITCPSPSFAVGSCSASTCRFTCMAGHADCNTSASDGCEVDLSTNVNNCGACARRCTTPPNAAPTCAAGTCGFTCLAGFADCDGNAVNGCEVNLATSPANCGSCGNMCVFANGTGVCTGGACQIGMCNAGFENCDGTLGNGCETRIATDLNNCGTCSNACPMGAHATATCSTGMCGATCSSGFGNCNGSLLDGCEATFASDPAHCGNCATACPARTNATATCASSTCGFACLPGFRDCNASATDGCEINTATNPNNCGGCGTVCAAPHTTPGCAAGACTIGTCAAGYADCNGVYSDGCEVQTSNDASNCGGCGVVCTGGRLCVASACTLVNPFPSTGAEGAFNPAVNTVLPPGVHNYTTINIPAGVTVTTSGSGVLDLRATGAVTISGTIDVTGGIGATGARPSTGGGGGFTGARTTAASGVPGTGGGGGAAPAGGASTGCVANSPGGANGGGAATVGVSTMGGGGGGGPAGGAGGLVGGACVAGSGGGGAPPGAGGQAGGPPYDGLPGQTGRDMCLGLLAGGGGGSVGSAAVGDLAMNSTFQVGSGGGGGSGSYGTGLSAAAGGGGGGAGAIRISSPVSITITASGVLRADGGAGGGGSAGNATCSLAEAGAGGGGGSGGAIYLASPSITTNGTINAAGGAGGVRGANASGGDGGAGGLGRIRLSVVTTTCTLGGTFNPPLRSACSVANSAGFTYIAQYPR